MAKAIQIYHWESKLDFGKYKGETLSELVAREEGLNYVFRALERIAWFCLSEKALKKFMEAFPKPTKNKRGQFVIDENTARKMTFEETMKIYNYVMRKLQVINGRKMTKLRKNAPNFLPLKEMEKDKFFEIPNYIEIIKMKGDSKEIMMAHWILN